MSKQNDINTTHGKNGVPELPAVTVCPPPRRRKLNAQEKWAIDLIAGVIRAFVYGELDPRETASRLKNLAEVIETEAGR